MRLVSNVLQSRDRVIGIQGGAGTGKTTALRPLRELAEANGYETRGLAPTSGAARAGSPHPGPLPPGPPKTKTKLPPPSPRPLPSLPRLGTKRKKTAKLPPAQQSLVIASQKPARRTRKKGPEPKAKIRVARRSFADITARPEFSHEKNTNGSWANSAMCSRSNNGACATLRLTMKTATAAA